MPPLENAKHERFAQALAAGNSAVEAYESAGYSRNRGHASTLRRNPKLLKRVDEILAFAQQRVPWAVLGYTAEIAALFKNNAPEFARSVEERRSAWERQAGQQGRG